MERRQFLGVLSLAGLTALTGGAAAQQSGLGAGEYSAAPTWIGVRDARLPADSPKFDELRGRIVYIATDTGEIAHLKSGDSQWSTLGRLRQGVTVINDAAQLPAASAGVSTLEPGRIYLIDGTVDIQNAGIDTVDVNGATVSGTHAGVDTLLTTGAGPLLRTRGTDAFISRLALSAPAGQVLDMDAQDDAAALADKQLFLLDTSVIANAADLGVIRGYRAQSFKGNAFDTYSAGLTHDGVTQKVLHDGNFVINGGDGVASLTFADTLQTDVVDIAGCYFLGYGSNPTVLDVVNGPLDGGDNPVQVAADYVRNFHDETLAEADILSGIDTTTERWNFQASAPLSDSYVAGNLRADPTNAPYTTTISTANTYVPLNATTVTDTAVRVAETAEGELAYRQQVTEVADIDVNLSLSAATTTLGVAIAVNGTVVPQSEMQYETRGGGTPVAAPCSANLELAFDDRIRIFVKNIDSTGNIDTHAANMTVRAA